MQESKNLSEGMLIYILRQIVTQEYKIKIDNKVQYKYAPNNDLMSSLLKV